MEHSRSAEMWRRAQETLVGGVNSPVRAFAAVGGFPFFVESGAGARILDVDGNAYLDYVLSWGPLITGHAHPHVVETVVKAMEKGASFGIPTEAETLLAERVARHYPSIEKLRLVNSGTEATMSAIRLARGYTGRDLVVKIEGCYHGHVDGLLVKAGSGLTTLGEPTSPGVPRSYAENTYTIPFNDLEAAEAVFAARGQDIACLIIEPVPGNMGVILPAPEYLSGLRELTRQHSSLLVFDEVMSGFRVALGGAQDRYGVVPDITTLGKVIGGGLPVGAYGATVEIMDVLAPVGPVYQAGTLAGNPLATAAGLATLDVIEVPGVMEALESRMKRLSEGLSDAATAAGIPTYATHAGAMGCLFFNRDPVEDYGDACDSNTARYAQFFRGMLERGFYFAPSQFEAFFMSTAHTDGDIDVTVEVAADVLYKMRNDLQ